MTVGLVGKKVGMTQVFDQKGKQVPVTVVKLEPTYVVQKRTQEVDGYTALQLGAFKKKKVRKPQQGQFAKAKVEPMRFVREIRTEKIDTVNVGDRISAESFEVGDFVNVTGQSIGKGFQGVVKRHGYSGGPAAHGAKFHREPGGIGARAGGKGCAKKVVRGKKLPGQYGNDRVTIHNLQVIDIDLENELMALKGSIPGGGNNIIFIENSFKKSPQKEMKVFEAKKEEKAQEEVPVQEAPKPEAKVEEAPKQEEVTPKAKEEKAEAPKEEAPAEQPKAEEAPKEEKQKGEAPKEEAPQKEKAEEPKAEEKPGEQPKEEKKDDKKES